MVFQVHEVKEMTKYLKKLVGSNKIIDIVCIGSPRVIGDAVGPLVGTSLRGWSNGSIRVIGDTMTPIVKNTFADRIKLIRKNSLCIVVDASIHDNYNQIEIGEGGVEPGSAVGQEISTIGDIAIKCRVTDSASKLCGVEAYRVYRMADAVSEVLRNLK